MEQFEEHTIDSAVSLVFDDSIEFVDRDVRERARPTGFLHRLHKILRPLDRDHCTTWPDDLGEIDSGITGSGADIEDAFARADAGAFPAI